MKVCGCEGGRLGDTIVAIAGVPVVGPRVMANVSVVLLFIFTTNVIGGSGTLGF